MDGKRNDVAFKNYLLLPAYSELLFLEKQFKIFQVKTPKNTNYVFNPWPKPLAQDNTGDLWQKHEKNLDFLSLLQYWS